MIKSKQHLLQTHNHTRNDPFFWLHTKSKRTMNLMKDINLQTKQSLCDQTDLQQILINEIKNRIFEDDKTIISKYYQYYYYTEIKKNNNYSKYYILKNKSSKPYCYLNLEKMSKKHPQFIVGPIYVSYDETFVIYSIDYKGDLKYTLYMKSLFSNKHTQLLDYKISNDYVIHPNNQSLYFKQII